MCVLFGVIAEFEGLVSDWNVVAVDKETIIVVFRREKE